jgi:hypothetical protein
MEDKPDKCKLKIAKSTAPLECAKIPLKGGYTVQPVPAPVSTILDNNNKINEGGNNQKLKLFNLGNAISGAPINKGTSQLPKPPIIVGITIKKIITKAWAVTTTLYNWWLPLKIWFPGQPNSNLINTEKIVPINPAIKPKIRYKVPISLWFVE